MKKILFAALFAFVTLGFTACDSATTSTNNENTDTTTTVEPETTPEEVAPADTTSMSADTTSAQ